MICRGLSLEVFLRFDLFRSVELILLLFVVFLRLFIFFLFCLFELKFFGILLYGFVSFFLKFCGIFLMFSEFFF